MSKSNNALGSHKRAQSLQNINHNIQETELSTEKTKKAKVPQQEQHLDIEKLQELDWSIKAVSRTLRDAPKENVAIFLGSTKAGKSALINYIMGNKLTGAQDSEFEPILLKKADTSPGPEIGPNSTSHTGIPGRWISKKIQEAIWDAPGFDDNRGIVQDIKNAFSIKELLTKVESAKIVLVVDFDHIKGNNINPFLKLLNSVEKILGNNPQKECFNGISIIFSKIPDEIYGQRDPDNKFIAKLLNKKFTDSTGLEISSFVKNLIQHFIIYPETIGLFKQVTVGDLIDANIDLGIIAAINNTKAISREILEQVSPSISNESEAFLWRTRQDLQAMYEFDAVLDATRDISIKKVEILKDKLNRLELSPDDLDQCNKDLSIIIDRVEHTQCDPSATLHQKLTKLQTIDATVKQFSVIEKLILDYALFEKVQFIEFIEKILGSKESEIFNIKIDKTVAAIMKETEILNTLIATKIQQAKVQHDTDLKIELESNFNKKMEAIELKYNSKTTELESALKTLKDYNNKTEDSRKEKLGVFAKIGQTCDKGVKQLGKVAEQLGKAEEIYNNAKTKFDDIRNCTIQYINEIEYDNPLLNHKSIIESFTKLYSTPYTLKLINITSILSQGNKEEIESMLHNPYALEICAALVGLEAATET